MAEVIDIIHKLTYDADTDVLKAVNDEFGRELKQMDELKRKEMELQALRDKTSADQKEKLRFLDGALAKTKKQYDDIAVSIGKQFVANEKLNKSLQGTAKNFGNITTAGSQLLREAPAFTFSIQTGFLALSNNIPILVDGIKQASAAGGTARDIFKALGSSIFGITGIITIATTLLTVFADKIFDTGEEAKKATDEYQKFLDAIRDTNLGAVKAIDQQVNKTKLLIATINDQTASQDKQNDAYLELQGLHPDVLAGITKEEFLTSNLTATIEAQIVAREKMAALQTNLVALQQKENAEIDKRNAAENAVINAQDKRAKYLQQFTAANRGTNFEGTLTQGQAQVIKTFDRLIVERSKILGQATKELQDRQLQIAKIQQAILQLNTQVGSSGETRRQRLAAAAKGDPYKIALDAAADQRDINEVRNADLNRLIQQQRELFEKEAELYQADQDSKRELSAEERAEREKRFAQKQRDLLLRQEMVINEMNQSFVRQKIAIAKAFNNAGDVAKFQKELNDLLLDAAKTNKEFEQNQEVIDLMLFSWQRPRSIEAPKKARGGDLPDFDRIQKKRDEVRKEIKDNLDYTFNETINTLNAIYEAQIYYLDKEIEARQIRVEQAVELAERGNTAILESERERLREAQEERDRVAKKQIQLNALLRASEAALVVVQSVHAVTNAAVGGEGYTAALRVAAIVAALTAGMAAIAGAAVSITSAFADGVIDLQGAGTETSDSIPARLSRGESVMTAAETRQFKPYLQAMRDGTFYNMVAATAIPVNAISGHSNKEITKELRKIVSAVEDSRLKQDIFFNEYGVGLMTQRAAQRERNRWAT